MISIIDSLNCGSYSPNLVVEIKQLEGCARVITDLTEELMLEQSQAVSSKLLYRPGIL